MYAGVWQSTPVSSRRRVRPVRLGPHGGRDPQATQDPKKFTMKAFHKFSQFNPYENKSIPINIAEVSFI